MSEEKTSSAVSEKNTSTAKRIIRIVASLTVVCICVALAVSASYSLTRDRIEEQRLSGTPVSVRSCPHFTG